MTDEAGSPQCRGLIEAKESLIQAMNSLSALEGMENYQERLRDLYTDLEAIHETRRVKESN